MPHCPPVEGKAFDPLSDAAARDPHPWLRAARREVPVFFERSVDAWFVTRYADVVEVLRQPQLFSSVGANTFKRNESPALAGVYPNGPPSQHSMVRKDPPEHTRVRRLAQKAYSPRVIDAMEPDVRRLCDRLIDRFVSARRCELIADYAERLSVRVISDLTGAPANYADDFVRWGRDTFSLNIGAPSVTPEQAEAIAARADRIMSWMHDFIEERRAHPRDDFVSALLHAVSEEGDPALTTDEVVGILNANFVAGVETTANAIALAVRDLLASPGLWPGVALDADVLTNVVEETLRMWSPARAALRIATAEAIVGGVRVPAGARVVLSFAAANRDDAVFSDAEAFDCTRPNASKHLAFGRFTHICLGAGIARLEVRVAIETLARRLPRARLAADQEEEWVPHLLVPGLKRLEIEW